MEKQKKERKKVLLGFLLLFTAVCIVGGTLFAYFSDYISGNGTVTAGTLDISGTYQYYVNGDSTPVTSITNFNPGDVVVVKATVTNSGNKSAWVRDIIDFGTLDAGIAPYIKLYEGEKTLTGITGAPTTDLLTLTAGKYTTSVRILDGTGTGAETETGANAIGANTYNVVFTIYFDKTATNSAQGKSVDFTSKTEAVQYRNNTTPAWTPLEQK
jgi:Camelysin metallo-endopeptidase.